MQVGVVYSEPERQSWHSIDVPDGTTVEEAIERSGILRQFPQIDLQAQKVGVFAKLVTLDAVLKPGDRVEIYRPIICDPKTVRRRIDPEESAAMAEGASAN